ncbi:hypothetical protein PY254_04655 [Rhodanobacter sp. AS-Z3]|uniref:hypothetical protein n=1 Tax=Rhodanobacter sp. AS-Z3 TaxID=3031330 RepID=UPI002478E119|nr:hypothetical protein [Rhodanobacter sp. AS-Z3]WEN15967.1 hypothetical protein PY254_04655 [Rhodanobacter sp. AS-Z3]
MKVFRICQAMLLAGGAILLVACSAPSGTSNGPEAAKAAASTASADAARNLDTYRQLLRIHNDEMAVTMGKDIVQRFPGTDAAREVQQTLPEVEKRYTDAREKSRLERLWVYQVAPMAGGTQSTASIDNSKPVTGDRVRLVLRRHTSWGQSVFLYGSKPGFVCRGNCTVATHFDDRLVAVKAFAPPTGEPALMIRDDKAFIAMLAKAKKISMDVTLVDGEKKQTLVYEVAGFDPAKWLVVGKKKPGKK